MDYSPSTSFSLATDSLAADSASLGPDDAQASHYGDGDGYPSEPSSELPANVLGVMRRSRHSHGASRGHGGGGASADSHSDRDESDVSDAEGGTTVTSASGSAFSETESARARARAALVARSPRSSRPAREAAAAAAAAQALADDAARFDDGRKLLSLVDSEGNYMDATTARIVDDEARAAAEAAAAAAAAKAAAELAEKERLEAAQAEAERAAAEKEAAERAAAAKAAAERQRRKEARRKRLARIAAERDKAGGGSASPDASGTAPTVTPKQATLRAAAHGSAAAALASVKAGGDSDATVAPVLQVLSPAARKRGTAFRTGSATGAAHTRGHAGGASAAHARPQSKKGRGGSTTRRPMHTVTAHSRRPKTQSKGPIGIMSLQHLAVAALPLDNDNGAKGPASPTTQRGRPRPVRHIPRASQWVCV